MKKISFTEIIYALPKHVHKVMLSQDSYKIWTKPFSETSDYKGDWSEGSKIYFTSDDGKGGMVSIIDENKLGESIVIRHVGILKNNEEILSGSEVDKWKNTLETYKFNDVEGHTRLVCTIEIEDSEADEAKYKEMWLKALRLLKEICEE